MSKQDLLVMAVMAAFAAFYFTRSRGTPGFDGAQARALVAQGATLLDVRTPEEFSAGHLPGALNIPLQELGGRIGELPAKNAPLVLYCRSGSRSGQARRMLESRGFTQVRDLGPMSRW